MSDPRTNILVLGIDGLRLSIALEDGVASSLSRLYARGRSTELEMAVPTISGPGWSTLLTGTTIAEHGVLDNTFVGHRLFAHPDLLSRAYYQDQSTRTFAAAGWPPLVSPIGLGPVIQQRTEQQKADLHRVIVRDGETFGYAWADGQVHDYTRAALSRSDAPNLSFAYFSSIDEAGHLYGLMGSEYRDAVRATDARIGSLVSCVEQRSAERDERWLVAVLTDHGHLDQGGHGGATPQERASFLLLWSPQGADAVPELPDDLAPEQVAGLLLAQRRPR
ncbi:alkaline phosphatase family protein [Raineyella sp. W15-4]|uniref:alkaline phosphatase family protein n=1 Tax=Raineyella sp. W15-4 TaxID=3081651 RepID=UPI002952FBAF|nr:alkaline phosphatase family protein [Raineyella sp. W15-4]WOQ17350.1 alkaline phosphatase family protein [Raineyella sp. W15-4]